MTHNDRSLLVVSAVLAIAGGVIIYFVSIRPIGNGIDNVLIVFLGMLSASLFSALSKFYNRSSSASREALSFDGGPARLMIEKIADDYSANVISSENTNPRLSRNNYNLLIGQDPVLALAKLRIDLEEEIRRMASENGMDLSNQKILLQSLIETLSSRGLIDAAVASAISDVIRICNSAIHGGDIATETAADIADIGSDLLRIIRSHRNKIPADRSSNSKNGPVE